MSEQIKVTGVVLSVFPIKETDKRLTILTKERGKLQVFANGSRRPKHPLFAISQQMVFAEFVLLESRNSYKLISGETIRVFPALRKTLDNIYYSTYFAELAEYFTVEGMEETAVLNLLYMTYAAMEKGVVPLKLIRRIFEFRIMACYGIGLESFNCLGCGKEEDLTTLSFENGGVYCSSCARQIVGTPISPAVLYTLQYVSAIPLNQLYSFSLKEEVFKDFEWIVKKFMRIHVDHYFKSEDMLDML